MSHCEPVTLVTPPDVKQSQVQDTTPKLYYVMAAATPNLSNTESLGLEELLTEYGDIFAMKNDD
jgi:hypothetical protein